MTPDEAERILAEAISKRHAMTDEQKDAEWRGIAAQRKERIEAWSGTHGAMPEYLVAPTPVDDDQEECGCADRAPHGQDYHCPICDAVWPWEGSET